MIAILERFFTSYTGRFLISVIWGLGLAALFKGACTGRNCKVIYQGPDPEEVQKSIYRYGSKNCYRYTPYLTKCEGRVSRINS